MTPFLKNNKISRSKLINAFTLVEIMVVVLIIVVISTLAMVSFTSTRVKSRDIKRVTNINTLQTALNAYYKDHGVFPAAITPGMPLRNTSNTKIYLDEVPFNPQPQADHNCSNLEYIYKVSADKQAYSLSACIGADNNPNKSKLIFGTKEGIFHCGDKITDRDGFTYGTVTIGSQCWMSENLKTKTTPNGNCLNSFGGLRIPTDSSKIPTAPDCTWTNSTGTIYGSYSILDARDCVSTSGAQGTEADCVAGRALYRVYDALQCPWTAACSSTSLTDVMCCNGSWVSNKNVKGICPEGWHVPTEDEFSTLEKLLATNPLAACNPLRTPGPPPVGAEYECAGAEIKLRDSLGFNAKSIGWRSGTTDSPGSVLPNTAPSYLSFPVATQFKYYGLGDRFITTNVDITANTGYIRTIDSSVGVSRKGINYSTGRAFSLRCLKD